MKRRARQASIAPKMKAAAIRRFGPPSEIRLVAKAVPTPAADEVLIRVETAGVGSWDSSIRDGSWRRAGPTRFPLVLGTDGAGEVVARGSRVKRLRPGDRVYAYEFGNPKGGFYAEYAAVKAKHAARVPRGFGSSLQAGAAVPTALTALQGIVGQLHLRPRQTVLIFGASGAVGTMAVQFAKHRGARVIATATGREAQALVRRLGADAVVDARSPDVADRLWKLAPDGIDAALAFAGGEGLERCLDLMRPGGRIAHPNGIEPGPPRKRRSMKHLAYDLEVDPAWFQRLARDVARAPVRVPIAAALPLSQARRAHQRLARGGIHGRLVLRVSHGRAPGAS
jgi:NADPH2:quinone reductase